MFSVIYLFILCFICYVKLCTSIMYSLLSHIILYYSIFSNFIILYYFLTYGFFRYGMLSYYVDSSNFSILHYIMTYENILCDILIYCIFII